MCVAEIAQTITNNSGVGFAVFHLMQRVVDVHMLSVYQLDFQSKCEQSTKQAHASQDQQCDADTGQFSNDS